MQPSTRSIDSGHDDLTADERLRCAQAELYQLDLKSGALFEHGQRLRAGGAPAHDLADINAKLGDLGYRRRALSDHLRYLELAAENEKHGWTTLADGTLVKIQPNGKVLSSQSWVSEFTDSDGTVYKETEQDQRRRAEQHKSVALAFQTHVTGERLSRATRRAPAARPTRPGRVTVVRRARAARATAPTRGSPDDDPDEPGEQTWALTFVDRAPVLWRLRAARCRYMEWREGVVE